MPTISWLKDGISIENNPDYRTDLIDGVCSLTIEETFVDDSAKFTCQASNLAGFAQTSATLKVEGNHCRLVSLDLDPGVVRPGSVRPGLVRPGSVRPGSVRPGSVRPGSVSHPWR